ncbi:pimeloyl-ACP methyl ester carboxylesterase [Streptomyces sp. SAI-135]|uniref:alpha/beta fold hydrolase n=1 Tax=unclassified Streptomyces TaxID=2593676 RepID=UPI002475AC27|nr:MULTISPECIES: alpha/beta hydrolase [unclassified Streptomyces]MDH6523057.1 pimeloyl-ACP methyl ester carboxylesterase [Streptomyces sp. SAI-090]MDH6554670.1 pimeloyl-ACP methyl ester carboxylesterase [Streptomyces sp. SAI-041]MDH6573940.1 pimeloyl-ACP methyl ester carboxylesterase [Streptomyces sp. SAI-117]MDH6581323.1 pimeloyl-ACP methyl ester carboxylesterase [Streptomyces sp. SAI-133]MDH6613330.1 pimeloyl-ACP methyl ester carboxylesterase [Streptomyces sp. SAI-135]
MNTPTAHRSSSRYRRLGLIVGGAVLAAGTLVSNMIGASATTSKSASESTHSNAPACVAPERPLSHEYDAVTRNDAAFNKTFRHCFTTISGVQMHYVIGGHGPKSMVLLHGWPESWYEFHGIMPKLLPGRTVVAVDLPGMGDSTGNPPSMEKKVLANYVHLLLNRLDMPRNVQVVSHDLGSGVGYALAAQYRDQVAGWFNLDFGLTGKSLKYATDIAPLSFHFPFHQQEPLAEQLVTGRVGTYLKAFYPSQSHVPQPVPAADVAEYVRVYSRPQVLHNGFELYRAWPQDEKDNAEMMETPLTIPVRVVSADGLGALELRAFQDAAPAATGTQLAGAGHWLTDERPEQVVSEINAFYPVS